MPQAVVMAGGQGERFWPLTHKQFPKYRLRFKEKTSLLAATILRLRSVYAKNQLHVVTTREHAPLIKKELPGFPVANLILEPTRKNTAAAILLASARIAHRYGPEEVVSFFPADHLIENIPYFKRTIQGAVILARQKRMLVTVGIQPTFPATGYGYIRLGKKIPGFAEAFQADRFVEKPDRSSAIRYLKEKKFLWNGGIFTWRSGVLIDTLKKINPSFARKFNLKDVEGSYRKLPNISVDYAVLEKASNIAVYRTAMDWCDLGSWDMFYDRSEKDSQKNCRTGVRLVCKDTKGSLVVSECSDRPLVVLGVSDLIVVQTKRGTLICQRSRSEEAALLAKQLEALSSRTRHFGG